METDTALTSICTICTSTLSIAPPSTVVNGKVEEKHLCSECAQKLLLLGHFTAAAVVLSWMDEEVAKLDH